MLPEITPQDLHTRLQAGEDIQLIDVREPMEFEYCRLAGSQLLPLGELPRRADEVRGEGPVVLVCHHGVRSMQALAYLQQRHGRQNLLNLQGGIDAWSRLVDAAVAIY
jgi:rhodanese-related sulfurtransferase